MFQHQTRRTSSCVVTPFEDRDDSAVAADVGDGHELLRDPAEILVLVVALPNQVLLVPVKARAVDDGGKSIDCDARSSDPRTNLLFKIDIKILSAPSHSTHKIQKYT